MNESIDEKEDSYTQMYTQTAKNAGKPKSTFISQNSSGVLRAGSSAWYECLTCTSSTLNSFEVWLLETHTRRYAKDLMRYARECCDVLQHPRKVSQIAVLSKDKRRMVMSALANLSKYMGYYEQWKSLVKTYGLKWEKKVSLDIVLDIMNTNLEDCWLWLTQVLEKIPREYGCVLVFTALTGLRPNEAVTATKLISDLDETGRLDDYLNRELQMLEHFRYGDLFLRRCKNAYISFITQPLLELITTYKPRIRYATLQTKIRRLGLCTRTKQLRKYHATTLREHLPTEAIDLLQGRINQSVFLRYYYKPFLKEIRDKTLKGIRPLQQELLEILS